MMNAQLCTVLMEEMTWPEIQAAVERGCHTVLLPAASVEQHGPHLPTGTDTILGYGPGSPASVSSCAAISWWRTRGGASGRSCFLSTVRELARIKESVDAGRLKKAKEIALRVGKVINRWKMGKHIELVVEDGRFEYRLKEEGWISAHRKRSARTGSIREERRAGR